MIVYAEVVQILSSLKPELHCEMSQVINDFA